MVRHVFDLRERASHELVAAQLHTLADEIAAGAVWLGYEGAKRRTGVTDPVDVTLDLRRTRHHAELVLRMRWDVEGEADAA